MINLEFTGMCKGCGYADLELDYIEMSSYCETKKEWSVRCKHADACNAMEDRTIARLKEDE